jgi:hypothetical protein
MRSRGQVMPEQEPLARAWRCYVPAAMDIKERALPIVIARPGNLLE